MTPGRRTLRFQSLDEIMPEVERDLGRLFDGRQLVARADVPSPGRHPAGVGRHARVARTTRRGGSTTNKGGRCWSRARCPRG